MFDSAQFDVYDVWLPLAVLRAKQAVFCHVGADFLTNAPDYRLAYFKKLTGKGYILRCVTGLPLIKRTEPETQTRRHQWLLIFKNKATMHAYCGLTVVHKDTIYELSNKE